ncbi:Uncharacterised protein [uncultured archaeon]|nr:Uncharacterised protein [uncultured archaeon]
MAQRLHCIVDEGSGRRSSTAGHAFAIDDHRVIAGDSGFPEDRIKLFRALNLRTVLQELGIRNGDGALDMIRGILAYIKQHLIPGDIIQRRKHLSGLCTSHDWSVIQNRGF